MTSGGNTAAAAALVEKKNLNASKPSVVLVSHSAYYTIDRVESCDFIVLIGDP